MRITRLPKQKGARSSHWVPTVGPSTAELPYAAKEFLVNSRPKGEPSYLPSLVSVEDVDATAFHGAYIASAAVSGCDYLAGHSWWPGMHRMFFGCCIVGHVAAFLVELVTPVGQLGDQWLWVVCGEGPAAYFVPDRVGQPADALLVYADLADEWRSAVGQLGHRGEVFPLDWKTSEGDLVRLHRLCLRVRDCVEAAGGGRDSSATWVDSATVPRNHTSHGSRGVPLLSANGAVGMMVRDHLGRLGIAVEAIPCPGEQWLVQQRDQRFRALSADTWSKVICVAGGSIAIPSSLLTVLGAPPRDVIDMALRNANEFGRRLLLDFLGKR